MPKIGMSPAFPVLDIRADGANNATNSTSPAIPGGITGFVPTKYLIFTIVGFVVAGAVITALACWRFKCYQSRARKKIDEAGNFQLNVSRPRGVK